MFKHTNMQIYDTSFVIPTPHPTPDLENRKSRNKKEAYIPFPNVFASMISLMRPGPTPFWAVRVNLYQVPHFRFSRR